MRASRVTRRWRRYVHLGDPAKQFRVHLTIHPDVTIKKRRGLALANQRVALPSQTSTRTGFGTRGDPPEKVGGHPVLRLSRYDDDDLIHSQRQS